MWVLLSYIFLVHYATGVVHFSPMIPLSLLSSVELGLVMVPQGLERLRGGRLVVLLRVEHGLSVLGDAVLLVSVEQGLIPWLVAEDWGKQKGKKCKGTPRMCATNQTCWWTMWSTFLNCQLAKCSHFCSMSSNKENRKLISWPYLEELRKV